MIELQKVHKVFNAATVNEVELFRDFDLHIPRGQFVSVVGSNGSGKTTLLNLISGTISADAGKILLDGADITALPEYKRARRIGRVFQDPSVGTVPDMTITENLSLAENKGKPYFLRLAVSGSAKNRYRELVASLGLGLESRMDVPVGLLSGGQRQALSLIMSTLTPVDLLLLDEHTAALDPKTADLIMELTNRIIREKSITALMVTHNLRYAVEYGDRLLMMHEGKTVLDQADEAKKAISIQNLLSIFNEISIECGN